MFAVRLLQQDVAGLEVAVERFFAALYGDPRFAAMRDPLAFPPVGSMLWNPTAAAV